MNNRWRRCMPARRGNYLVTVAGGSGPHVTVGFLTRRGAWFEAAAGHRPLDVLAWMPLPEPWTEEPPEPAGTPILALDVPVRALNALSRAGVETVEELAEAGPKFAASLENVGTGSFNAVAAQMRARGHDWPTFESQGHLMSHFGWKWGKPRTAWGEGVGQDAAGEGAGG